MDGSVGLRRDRARDHRHLHALTAQVHRGQGQEGAHIPLGHHAAILVEVGRLVG